MHCNECEAMFSTQEIFGMAIAYHKDKAKSDVVLPIHDYRLDIATYRYPYDYQQPDIHDDKFLGDKQLQSILLHKNVDKHDRKNNPSCFKNFFLFFL